MKKSFLVIGLGRFGSNVAKTLVALNCDVLAVDINEEAVQAVSKVVGQHCIVADTSKASVINEIMGKNVVDHAVVGIGNNLQASILTIVNLKNIGVPKITVRADMEAHRELYMMVGATEVVVPEEASAISLANQIQSDSTLDYYNLSKEYAIVKISVGDNFQSKSLIELNIRNAFDVNIVGIIKNNGEFFIPRGTDLITPKDIVVAVGTRQKLKKFDGFLNS